jgi:hypothetical protein
VYSTARSYSILRRIIERGFSKPSSSSMNHSHPCVSFSHTLSLSLLSVADVGDLIKNYYLLLDGRNDDANTKMLAAFFPAIYTLIAARQKSSFFFYFFLSMGSRRKE